MQNQYPNNYQSMIDLFKKSHRRGVALFEKVYGNKDSELYFILVRREWHRFYLFKKCIRYLEKCGVRNLEWLLAEFPGTKQVLSTMMKNICALSPQSQFKVEKWLDAHLRWAVNFKRTESEAETGAVSTTSISAFQTGEHETKIN